jgi:hypothetical protein
MELLAPGASPSTHENVSIGYLEHARTRAYALRSVCQYRVDRSSLTMAVTH